MARKTVTTGDAVVDGPEVGEQGTLPGCADLDMKNDKHKAMLRAVKAYHKAKAARLDLLDSAKEDQDAKEARALALMHECGISKFKHGDVEANIGTKKERLTVKLAADDDENDDQKSDDDKE